MSPAAPPSPERLAEILGMPLPTPEQARIIAHPLAPLLVVAGAGSGKTATMSQRVVHLVAGGQVRPDQILGLTFTRKATAELEQRVRTRLAQLAVSGLPGLPELDEEAGPTIATYNAFAGSLVRDHGLRLGIDPDSTLITEARAWQIATRIVTERTEPLPLDKPGAAATALLALDGALSENLLSVADAAEQLGDLAALMEGIGSVRGCKTLVRGVPEALTTRLGMLEAVAAYRDYKLRHSLLDFGDQIALGCRIAEEVPDVAQSLRTQYPAVLLDEFQDTSVAQIRLLAALFSDSGVTAVGDPNQAIYGWRGASAGALDTFHEYFNPGGAAAAENAFNTGGADESRAPVLPLSTAWRNDRAILRAANVTSSPLRHHAPQPGDAEVARIPVDELHERPGAAGLAEGVVVGAFVQDPLAEARTIADFMEERWSPQAEMAVLCRTRAQLLPIADALDDLGVPYEIIGLGGMLSVPEVADVRAALTVAADPERGDRLLRLLTGAGIGAADLRALAALARAQVRSAREQTGDGRDQAEREQPDAPLLSEAIETLARWEETGRLPRTAASGDAEAGRAAEAGRVVGAGGATGTGAGAPGPADVGLSEAGRRAAVGLARSLRRVRAGLGLALPDLVMLTEQALGLDVELAARVGNPLGRRAVDRFREAAEQFTAEMESPTLAGFLDWLEAAEEHENGMEAPHVEPEPGAVQLLTIHAAKGLEWDTVAVAGLVEQVFPSYRQQPKEDRTLSDKGWMTRPEEFPHPLRADAATLPPFTLGMWDTAGWDAEALKEAWGEYTLALGRHTLAEERRLAYVAFTRARHELLLTGSHLAKAAAKPRPMARFLDELVRRELVRPYGPGWQNYDEDQPNPLAGGGTTGTWPPPEPTGIRGEHREARRRAAHDVAAAGRAGAAPEASTDPTVARWVAEAELLLAERARRRDQPPSVHLPDHLAATRIDELRADRDRFALDLRRPLPPEPRPELRLGTVFHDAIALRLGGQGQLLTLEQAGVPDALTPRQRKQLERWLEIAERLPLLDGCLLQDTEVELELALESLTVRCRLDAVFRDPGGAWLIVDWKTGRRRVPVDQLSIYVHALAASRGVETDAVRAAYVYVDRDDGLVDELSAADLLPLSEIEDALRAEGRS